MSWKSKVIVTGTKIGILLEFNQAGYATVTGYKDGVRIGVLSTGALRGPLCPSVWMCESGQSVEFVG